MAYDLNVEFAGQIISVHEWNEELRKRKLNLRLPLEINLARHDGGRIPIFLGEDAQQRCADIKSITDQDSGFDLAIDDMGGRCLLIYDCEGPCEQAVARITGAVLATVVEDGMLIDPNLEKCWSKPKDLEQVIQKNYQRLFAEKKA